MPAPEIIHQLVKRFDEHRDTYRSGKYNETQLRREFLGPFFEALGWDVFNKGGWPRCIRMSFMKTALKLKARIKSPIMPFRLGDNASFL